jgi:hypothetical protein
MVLSCQLIDYPPLVDASPIARLYGFAFGLHKKTCPNPLQTHIAPKTGGNTLM